MGIGDSGAAFTAIVQFGTQFAVLLYFRKEIAKILGCWFRTLPSVIRNFFKWLTTKGPRARFPKLEENARIGWLIILGSLPIVVLGVLLKDSIETSFRSLWITAVMLIVFGIVLWVSDISSKRELVLSKLTPLRALYYGLAQSLALIPGVSRSGSTIAAGRFMGFTRETAAKFSFYLSIPSVFGAGIFELKDVFEDVGAATSSGFPGWTGVIVATIIAFIVGYLVIAVFMKLISKISFKPFAIYRIVLGITLLISIAFFSFGQ
jgi:undecaprenyl-diphosphatase